MSPMRTVAAAPLQAVTERAASPAPDRLSPTQVDRTDDDRTTQRNVVLLAACQGLLMTGMSMNTAVSALVGHLLADEKSLATLPMALIFLATMLSTVPASLLTKRIGRRAGFSVGVLIGMAGASIMTYGVVAGSFWVFALGGIPLGAFNGFGQLYRFAAADHASAAYRPRAISYVLAGGIAAAIAGPALARWSMDLLAPIVFAGSFASLLGLQVSALLLLQWLKSPQASAAERNERGRPFVRIAREPAFAAAVLCGAIGYAAMNFVMTSTPLAMAACGLGFGATAFVMQAHLLGMFVPSLFTGSLIARFGVLEVMLAGAALVAASIAVNAAGVSELHFVAALVLLGVGWNFLYVGATTLLSEVGTRAERNKIQAANDFLVFGSVALAAFGSGVLHELLGWQNANLVLLPALALAALVTVRLRTRGIRAMAA